nr:Crp/Fnr family transcriptional regulator [Allomuricauda sp.]
MERYIPDRIKRRVGFKKEFDTVLKTHFKLKKYAKGDTLFIQNELCNKVFFIKRGIVKKFYINVDGNEITADFAMEGEFMFAANSMAKPMWSVYTATVLEESAIYSISHSRLDSLVHSSDQFAQSAFYVLFGFLHKNPSNLKDYHCLRAKERYEKLLHNCPDIFERAKVIDIASYLGLAPETVSRLRSKSNPKSVK